MVSSLSREKARANYDTARPGGAQPRTLELPDEEFCEVARVDELPERGTRSGDGERRAVFCARVASAGAGEGGG